MPLQDFLASYAVRVDEDGARRLQRILDQNRTSAESLTKAFSSARAALASLKKELSGTAGLRNVLSGLTSGGSLQGISGASLSLPDRILPSASLSGTAKLSVSADFSSANEALDSWRSKAETLRPKLSVNPTGITSAVASAIASVRTMLSAVSVSVPVRAVAKLDTSQLPARSGGITLAGFASGGRVDRPTLAMLAEEGLPEYVIPAGDEARALPLLRSLIGEMSENAKASLFLSAPSGSAPVSRSVQAPVSISVTSTAASAEAVGRSVYDVTRRSLLKTLEGVFA